MSSLVFFENFINWFGFISLPNDPKMKYHSFHGYVVKNESDQKNTKVRLYYDKMANLKINMIDHQTYDYVKKVFK